MPSGFPFLAQVRYALAAFLQAVGLFLAFVSGMATIGVHMAPDAQAGLIVCFLGIETVVAGFLLVRGLPRAPLFFRVLRGGLASLAFLTLLGGMVVLIFKRIYHVRPDEWGAPPPEFILWEFGAGSISLINLVAISLWTDRKKLDKSN